MKYQVYLISEAEEDIFDIYKYILINDSEDKANYVFNEIQKCCYELQSFPSRGHCPPELDRIGIHNYKEVHFKPYRIIYEIMDKKKVWLFNLEIFYFASFIYR